PAAGAAAPRAPAESVPFFLSAVRPSRRRLSGPAPRAPAPLVGYDVGRDRLFRRGLRVVLLVAVLLRVVLRVVLLGRLVVGGGRAVHLEALDLRGLARLLEGGGL